VTLQAADRGDTATLAETLCDAGIAVSGWPGAKQSYGLTIAQGKHSRD
jgi:hypothetical protein